MVADTLFSGEQLVEGWGDWVDPREYLSEDPTFLTGGSAWQPFTRIDDRLDGKYLPYYETEEDLARIRGQSRNLAALDSVAIGASDVLAHYVLGNGFDFQVECKDETLRKAAQAVVERFLDVNDVIGTLDRELHQRSREDGEAFIWLKWHSGNLHAVTLEPDQIVEPSDPRPVEDWLGVGEDYVSSWTFGVHCDARLPHVPLHYYVIHDGRGVDFDVVPSGQLMHIRRNVVRTAKRGVSDYFPIVTDLRNAAKLKTNLATGSAMQAAIAWVEEFPPGTLQADVNALDRRLSETQMTRTNASGITQTTSTQRILPGTIVRPSPGRKYGAAPLGSERSQAFIEVASYLMRCVGVRWTIPEYIISGDASNANFASTLVAESPFVKAREADQQFYVRQFYNLVWKVFRLYFEQGVFNTSWEQFEAQVDVTITPPEVATRDPLAMAQRQQLQIGMGFLSKRTAATEAGLDYEEEVSAGAGQQPAAPALPGEQPVQQALPFAESHDDAWENYP